MHRLEVIAQAQRVVGTNRLKDGQDAMLSACTFIPGLAGVAAAALVVWAGLPASAAPTTPVEASRAAHSAAAVPSPGKVVTFRSATT